MNHFEASLMVLSQKVDSKVLRMAAAISNALHLLYSYWLVSMQRVVFRKQRVVAIRNDRFSLSYTEDLDHLSVKN